jgi:anti-sigma factor RsiW
MNCKAFQSRLSAYLDRELSGQELLQMRDHLARCEECRTEEAEIRTLKALLGNLPAPEPSADLADKLCATVLRERMVERSWTPRRSFFALAGVAACSMLATFIVLGLVSDRPADLASGPAPEELAFEVQRDQVYSIGMDATEGAPMISFTSYAGR